MALTAAEIAEYGKEAVFLILVCDGDEHDNPEPVVRFGRQSTGRWRYMGQSRSGRAFAEWRYRQHRAATGEHPAPGDVKTTFRCTECGNNLEIGAGKWGRLEAALDGIATVLAGQTITFTLLRGAYQHAA